MSAVQRSAERSQVTNALQRSGGTPHSFEVASTERQAGLVTRRVVVTIDVQLRGLGFDRDWRWSWLAAWLGGVRRRNGALARKLSAGAWSIGVVRPLRLAMRVTAHNAAHAPRKCETGGEDPRALRHSSTLADGETPERAK